MQYGSRARQPGEDGREFRHMAGAFPVDIIASTTETDGSFSKMKEMVTKSLRDKGVDPDDPFLLERPIPRVWHQLSDLRGPVIEGDQSTPGRPQCSQNKGSGGRGLGGERAPGHAGGSLHIDGQSICVAS